MTKRQRNEQRWWANFPFVMTHIVVTMLSPFWLAPIFGANITPMVVYIWCLLWGIYFYNDMGGD